jgi:peptide/nickel transport system permease protein
VGLIVYGALAEAVRVVRAAALSVRVMPYIDAARAAGYSHTRIIFRHMAPNVVAPYLIMLTAFVAQAILAEASLSFLGLGIPPPAPSWGAMLDEGRNYLTTGWWLALFPGLAILLLVLGINLVGDWLRDALDPRVERSM